MILLCTAISSAYVEKNAPSTTRVPIDEYMPQYCPNCRILWKQANPNSGRRWQIIRQNVTLTIVKWAGSTVYHDINCNHCSSHITIEIPVDQATCHPEDSTENIHRDASEL